MFTHKTPTKQRRVLISNQGACRVVNAHVKSLPSYRLTPPQKTRPVTASSPACYETECSWAVITCAAAQEVSELTVDARQRETKERRNDGTKKRRNEGTKERRNEGTKERNRKITKSKITKSLRSKHNTIHTILILYITIPHILSSFLHYPKASS